MLAVAFPVAHCNDAPPRMAIPETHGFPGINDRTVLDNDVVFAPSGLRRLRGGGASPPRNFAQSLACDFLSRLRIIQGHGDHVNVQRENQFLPSAVSMYPALCP
jgi:hypothetical protein